MYCLRIVKRYIVFFAFVLLDLLYFRGVLTFFVDISQNKRYVG